MSIQVSDLSFSYGPRRALERINFELEAGCFNALLGPNGAGKSTLFALLTRLYALQRGEIRINGFSIRHQPGAVMRQLGVVFQQSTLDLDLTVTQNLRYHASLHGLAGAAARRRINRELQRMQLLERAEERVRDLNGGYRRRVEIARALLHEPSVLLLDEASVGLDPASRQALNHHVRALCAEQQITVLWASHLIEEVEPQDPVLLLHQGRLLSHHRSDALCRRLGTGSLHEAFHRLTGMAAPTPQESSA